MSGLESADILVESPADVELLYTELSGPACWHHEVRLLLLLLLLLVLLLLLLQELSELSLKQLAETTRAPSLIELGVLLIKSGRRRTNFVLSGQKFPKCFLKEFRHLFEHHLLVSKYHVGIKHRHTLRTTAVDPLKQLRLVAIVFTGNLLGFWSVCEHFVKIRALVYLGLAVHSPPVAGVKPEEVHRRMSALALVVVVGAMSLLAFPTRRPALHGLIIEIVVLLLLPAVAMTAAVLKTAAIGVGTGFFLVSPSSALILGVAVDMELSAKVLPVMRVNANIPRMISIFFVAERAPHSFEMEQVEVGVPLHSVQIVDRELILVVRECTHLAEFTSVCVVWVGLTEFRLVLLRVIEVLHSVVRSWAAVS